MKKDGKLFDFLIQMNKGNYDFVDSLSDEEVKSLSPFVISMWVNGANQNQKAHIICSDIYCNEYIFNLKNHPRLLLKLFVSANSEIDNTRYSFKKCVSERESNMIKYISEYYKVDTKTAKDYLEILDKEDLEYIQKIKEI